MSEAIAILAVVVMLGSVGALVAFVLGTQHRLALMDADNRDTRRVATAAADNMSAVASAIRTQVGASTTSVDNLVNGFNDIDRRLDALTGEVSDIRTRIETKHMLTR
jgi:hypothetical protein